MEYRTLPERLLTADDFLHMPDEDGWWTELEQGRVVREPYPGAEHGQIVTDMAALLQAHVRPNRLGVVFSGSGFKLQSKPDTVRGPDVAFVSNERIPPEGVPKGFLAFG